MLGLRDCPRAWRLLTEVIGASKAALAAYLAIRLVEAGAAVLLPVLLKWETDQLAQRGEPLFPGIASEAFHVLLAIIAAIVAVRLVQYLVSQGIGIFEEVRSRTIDDALMIRLYARLADAEIGVYLHARNALAMRQGLAKSGLICHHMKETVGRAVAAVAISLGMTGVLLAMQPWILVAVLAGSLASALASRAEQRLRRMHAAAADYGYGWRIALLENELAANLPKLVVNDGHHRLLHSLRAQFEHRLRGTGAEARRRMVYGWAGFLSANLVEFAVKIGVGYGIFYAGASLGTVVLAMVSIEQFRSAMSALVGVSLEWRLLRRDLQDIDGFLAATEPHPGRVRDPDAPRAIAFAGVGFAYPGIAPATLRHIGLEEQAIASLGRIDESGRERLREFEAIRAEAACPPAPVLHGIDLQLRRGEMVALIGANGAGKSTVAMLLLGYFDRYDGVISFDGVPAGAIARDWFRRHISVVHQSPFILDACSIRENLLLGVHRPLDDAALWRVLDEVGLAERIRSLRRGLDAECNADGGLSGGQRQLLALGRVLLQDRSVLILDEGTNQLDPEHEDRVMGALMARRDRCAILCISHRMPAIRRADRILAISGGRIAESGTHLQLMAHGGIYAGFWRSQMGTDA